MTSKKYPELCLLQLFKSMYFVEESLLMLLVSRPSQCVETQTDNK